MPYEIAGTMWLQCDTRSFLQGLNVFQLDHVFQYSQCGHIVNKGRNFVNENEEDANEVTQAAKNDNERSRFRLPGRGLSSDFSSCLPKNALPR